MSANPTISTNTSIVTAYEEFMKKHRKIKDESNAPATNTRIGSTELNIYGGTYHIPVHEYNGFLKLYAKYTLAGNNSEYLTEMQLQSGCPILIDMDMRYPETITTRQHEESHIEDVVDILADELSKLFQFDENTKFNIYIQQKPAVHILKEKNITKDGVHIIVGLNTDRQTQIDLRKRIIPRIEDSWNGLPLTNTWNDVIDDSITSGKTGWQLYGSRKPGYGVYRVTNIYEITYDPEDSSIQRHEIPLDTFDEIENIEKLSARCTSHPSAFFSSEYARTRANAPAAPTAHVHRNVPVIRNGHSISVSNADQLQGVVNDFLDNLVMPQEYELKEAHDYTMILPEMYYGVGSFAKWIRVGWALRNISDKLCIVWIAFSAQSPQFSYSDIPGLMEKWNTFDLKNPHGLTKRSIMHWAKQDVSELYKKVRATTIDHHIDQTVKAITLDNLGTDRNARGCTDTDLANVLYQMYKDEFVCVSVKNNVWYKLKGHRWVENDSGTNLRMAISSVMRDLYWKRASAFMEQASSIDPPDEERTKRLQEHADKILKICERLGRANEKKNIMTEAKELFYDSDFVKKLDTNPYLLSFKNGVVDFAMGGFRKGYPEDYLSKCTNIDYVPMDTSRDTIIMAEIADFMRKLFPIEQIHDYMWEHLASTLIGTSANQTFNMYIGIGQNGKSVLVDLMTLCLGDYKADVPLPLITDKRTKIGGLAPELLALKGARLAVINEPSKGDQINEGIMKQLTSGIDPIQARAPYMLEAVTFIPQFKLVVCSNEFMVIRSQDHGTWRRIRVVDFVSLFTENPVEGDREKPYQFLLDRHIKEKFESWKTVFMAMLVDIAIKTKGVVKDCPRVMAASNSYKESLDFIGDFVRDCFMEKLGGKVSKETVKQEFVYWHESNYGGKLPSIREVHTYMDKKFGKYATHGHWPGIASIKLEQRSHSNSDDSDEDNDTNDISANDL
jgi:P4 family phage/plasmid primase-like protien